MFTPFIVLATSFPDAGVDPIVDGAFTDAQEYQYANVVPDDLGVGDFYKEHREDWMGYTDTITFFENHYFYDSAYGQLDGYDLNMWDFKWGDVQVTTWIFLETENTPDQWWLHAVELGSSPLIDANGDLFDDGGFLVRLNDDPNTDRQWKPGDPEPGDAGWNFADYYGVFARGGFNTSANDIGLSSVTDSREIYEWSITMDQIAGGIPGGGGGDNPPAPGICDPIWELQTKFKEVTDWKPEMGGHGIWGGPGWIPYDEWVLMGYDDSMHPTIPEPATMLLFGTGLVGLIGSRLRKKKQ